MPGSVENSRKAPPRATATIPFGTGRSRRYLPWASIAIPGLGWLIFGLYPSLATIFYSLTQYSGLPGTPLDFTGFSNYVDAFTKLFPALGQSLRITIEYCAGVTVFQNLTGLGMAFLLNKSRKGYGLWRALVFMPEIFSVAIVGAIFALLFDPLNGPLESIYHALTGQTSLFLGSTYWALPLVIFVTVWLYTGYNMLIYIAGLRNIPREVDEAAMLDGAGRWAHFRHVTWPLLAPAATVNIWLTAMGALGQYALILVLTDGNFGTKTLGFYMFDSAFGSGSQLGYGSMLAMMQFFLTLFIGGGLLILLRRREVQL